MRDTTKLHPELQTKLAQLLNECVKQGLNIGIGECVRTIAEQDALYAKGRTTAGKKVTNAKGSSYSSMHQWGVAFDFFKNIKGKEYDDSDKFFEKVGGIGVALGLEWGGNWKSPVDKPHLQLKQWGSSPSKLKKEYGTPEKFMATWQKSANTEPKTTTATTTSATPNKTEINPYNEPIKTVDKGSKGEGCKWVQWHLKRLGFYTGNIDGDFGTKSDTALRNFQKSANLTVDGKCGKLTRAELKK